MRWELSCGLIGAESDVSLFVQHSKTSVKALFNAIDYLAWPRFMSRYVHQMYPHGQSRCLNLSYVHRTIVNRSLGVWGSKNLLVVAYIWRLVYTHRSWKCVANVKRNIYTSVYTMVAINQLSLFCLSDLFFSPPLFFFFFLVLPLSRSTGRSQVELCGWIVVHG